MKLNALCLLLTLFYLSNYMPLFAQSNGFSLSAGTNVAYLSSKQDVGPGAYFSTTLTKSKFQLALAVSGYFIDKQYRDCYVVSDLDQKFFLGTIQSRLSLGYNVLNYSKISLAPIVGVAIDWRSINTLDTYETKPGTEELVGYAYKLQTRRAIAGVLLGAQSRLVLSRHLSLDFWSHFQRFQEKKPSNIEEALSKGNVWLTGLGLAYHW